MSVSGPLLEICDGLSVKMLLQNVAQVCIPNHVRELENDCFRYCGNLSHITHAEPSLVQKIGRRPFLGHRLRVLLFRTLLR